jgi:hypothetical protein
MNEAVPEIGHVSRQKRSSRSGSETRRLTVNLQVRLLPEEERALREAARVRGLTSAQDLIRICIEPIFRH